ncbi:ras-like protein family member 11B isoform X1 [Macrosteles quadrilineatus]|uniref:ras-like protein family member 11B isoform X1 n=2 Tax=Macrosteles quadrilineatus TaxID=74068 RepID=UPI0023E2BD37|nr:ras-like protein family member 11B isoform X1 [Macrosteles quadrilineatus]
MQFHFVVKGMKTEDRNSANLPKVRIAVLGRINVGKSAVTVRYLTRRYIGEYRSNTDLLYRQTVTINNTPVEVEIIDVSGDSRDASFPTEQVQWADGCLIVYSITDKKSFNYAMDTLDNLQKLRPNSLPVTLMANKADLEHLREVMKDEGRSAALQNGCSFFEVSVAENSEDLYTAFEMLLNESRCQQGNNKTRKFSVSKMFGTLIGGGNSKEQKMAQGGTVVVCHKSDLHKTRVLKRRQNFTATASL